MSITVDDFAPPAGQPAPRFLRAGDEISLGIDGLGQQQQCVVGYRAP